MTYESVRGGESHHSAAAGPKQRRRPTVPSAQLQQPSTAQTTAGQDKPWSPAETAATWLDSGGVWRY